MHFIKIVFTIIFSLSDIIADQLNFSHDGCAGLYLYRIEADGFSDTKKMVFLK